MGFNIKNNYGPNIEVKEGGVVNLHQSMDGKWHTAEGEEAYYEEADDNEYSNCEPSIGSANDYKVTLSTPRQSILDQLLNLSDKGDWVNGITSEDVKAMLMTVLGQGEASLEGKEAEMSEKLWHLLESGRSERLRVTWQNMVGYYDDRRLLKQKSAPALNVDFFGDKNGSDNINKGRPSRDNMPSGFRDVLPLLDAYVPKLDKKA